MFQADGWKLDEQGNVNFGNLYLTIDFRPEEPGDFVAFRFVGGNEWDEPVDGAFPITVSSIQSPTGRK